MVIGTVLSLTLQAQPIGFERRMLLSVDNTKVSGATAHVDFPILVSITDNDLRSISNIGDMQNPSGYDIVFTSSDGNTLLDFEIENYDALTGTINAWVRIPSLSTTLNTDIYLYFNKTGIYTNPSLASTWPAHYKTVLHLNSTTFDATPNANDFSNFNTTPVLSGIIGGAREFTGDGDYLLDDDAELYLLGQSAFTISMWIKADIIGTDKGLFYGDPPDGRDRRFGMRYDAAGGHGGTNLFYCINRLSGGSMRYESASNVQTTNWQHVVFSWTDGSIMKLYFDGVLDTPDWTRSRTGTTSRITQLLIGQGSMDGPTSSWDGLMDEIRIDATELSADWISTEYNNQFDPATFIVMQPTSELPILENVELIPQSFSTSGGSVPITSSVNIFDYDNRSMVSATIQISGNYISPEDTLVFTPGSGISGIWNEATGLLTLSGNATKADWEVVLKSVRYDNSNLVPSIATRTIDIVINDGINNSVAVARDILMNAVNNAPILAGIEGSVLAYTDGDIETPITNILTVSDVDDAYMEGATITIIGNYHDGEDRLTFTNTASINGSWSTVSGTLILSGTAGLTDYQNALRAVNYYNINHDPIEVLRTISIQVYDGADSSNISTRDISVTKVNDAPLISNVESTNLLYAPMSGPSNVSYTLNVTDYDNTTLDSAKIQVTGNYVIGEDTLVYSGGYGLTSSWDNINGLLRLLGTISVNNYQSALRLVTYENLSANPSSLTRTVTYSVSDGLLFSTGISRGIASSVPATINNLEVWLKGDAGTYSDAGGTVPAVNNGDVLTWTDQSGNARAFLSDGRNDPTYVTNVATLNGNNAIQFADNRDYFQDAAGDLYINGLNELTIFFVVQSNLTATDRGFLNSRSPRDSDRNFSLRYAASGQNGGGTDILASGLVNTSTTNILESSSDKQTTDPQVVCLDWQSGQIYNMYLDGVLDGPTYLGSLPVGPIADATYMDVGRGPYDRRNSWDGLIAEVIFYGRHLSETERLKVEDYLSSRYDIPVRLIGLATGGEEISADNANTLFTTLSGPRIREDYIGELTTGGTLILDVPTGYEWDTSVIPIITIQPAFGTSTTLSVSFTSATTSQVTFTINSSSLPSGFPGELTIAGLAIRPTIATLPNTGYITNSGTTGPSSSVSLGLLKMVAGLPSKTVFIQEPSTATMNEIITPEIIAEVRDQNDNAIEEFGRVVDLALSSGTGILSGTFSKSTDITGQVSFTDITINQVGTKILTASSLGLTDAVCSPFDVYNPGAFTTFLIERPSGGGILTQIAGQSFDAKISAVDGTNTVDASFTGTVDIISSGILTSGSGTTANFVGGVLSSHSMTISNAGDFTLTATNSAGSEYGISNIFTVEPGPASVSTSTVSASPSIIINNGISTSIITVTLFDAVGNAMTAGGEVVNLISTAGTLIGPVIDNGDSTYTQSLLSGLVSQTALVTAVLNGVPIVDNAEVTFSAISSEWESDPGSDAYTTDWNDTRNWDTDLVPTISEVVLIPANPTDGTKQPIISTNTSVGGVVVESGADITLQGGFTFTIAGDAVGDGDINGSASDILAIEGDVDIASITMSNVRLSGTAIQTVTSPLSYSNLEINSGTEVTPVNDLIVNGTLTLTAGTLVIPSGKSLIANTKSISGGSLKFERDIIGNTGWRILSAPVISTYGDFLDSIFTQGYTGSDSATGSPSVLWYDETYSGTDNQRWRKPSNITDVTVPGRGLFVYVFGDIAGNAIYSNPLPVTLDVSGVEEEGTAGEFDFSVTYSAAGDTGWNLIGNPFGATIDWDNFNWTKTNIEQTIYVWDNSANSGQGDYLLWNGLTGSLGSGLLPPFQGFWVKANAPNPVLKINKSGKTSGGVYYKKAIDEISQITLALETDTLFTTAFIMFHPESHIHHDTYDGYRLTPPTDTFLELGIIRDDGLFMTIESVPDRFGIPIQLSVETGGSSGNIPITGLYELSWYDIASLHEDWIVELIDNQTSQSINMRETQTYDFSVNSGGTAFKTSSPRPGNLDMLNPVPRTLKRSNKLSRFTVKIDPGDSFPEIPKAYSVEPNYPNPFNPTTTIQFNLPLESTVGIKIYNLLGREIAEFDAQKYSAGSHKLKWNASAVSSGIYFTRVQINETYYTQKMTVIK
ncbi:MAG: DUF2341 domain-containing protein [Candidatus Marinimicrobia bacterium]|nr:DUF2341 domain-containing protein [Candidatus Neomarinimicrobiota bacterium]